MKLHKKISIVIVLLFGSINTINTVPVGSNNGVAKQAKTFFSKNDNDNEMTGFSVFEDGIILEDASTESLFNAFFPVSGSIILNGGTLSLSRDVTFKSPLQLGGGTIKGNGFAIEFPGNVSNLKIPTMGYEKALNELDQASIGQEIKSVDWCFDGNYVALCTKKGGSEIRVYSVSNNLLTFVTSYDPGNNDTHSIRWHPSDYYLAVGHKDGTELRILSFDTQTETLSEESSADMGKVQAVAWSPNGNYLAVGESNVNDLRVYAVSNGVLGTLYTEGFSVIDSTVSFNALDWDSTGNYIVVGVNKSPRFDRQKHNRPS